MTTLHLQTDLGSNSASSYYNHSHGHPGIPRCPNEADYAAVTPTAARPHPERAALFEGVYGSRPALHQPPAGVLSMDNGLLAGSQLQHEQQLQLQPGYGVQYQQQQQQQQQLHSTFAHHVLQNTRSSSSSTCPSESESSSESAPSAGGPPTPPSSNAPSSLSISRGASPAIPGNTIYTATAYRHAPHPQQQQYSMHLAFPGSQMVAAPTQPYGHTYIQPAQAQSHCADYATTAAPQYPNYASNQLTYTPYLGSSYYASHRPTPPRAFRGAHFWRDLFPCPFIGTFDCRSLFHSLLTLPYLLLVSIQNNQYAIYNNGPGNEVLANSPPPGLMPSGAVQAQSLSKASDVQISPNMPYNTISTEHPIEPSTGMNPFTLLSRSDNVSPNYASYQASSVAVGAVAPVQATNTHTTLGHAHSASQSSISSCTNSLSGSPAPSLSGSDDSGNTSKSTLSQLSISNLSGNRSNPSSRRGSISLSSNTGANAGTPYGSARKDGDKKFVCSYPGCTRAFSRNFNLSTHYNTHLGIKPFPCSHCPKSFSRRHDCARHIAAVHASEAHNGKNRHVNNGGLDENGSISPNSCGCGHTCPAHNKLSNNTISTMRAGIPASTADGTLASNGEDSGNYRTSAFAFIKGERQVEDDLFSSSSGYEPTTSSSSYSIDSFIGRFNNNTTLDNTVVNDNNGRTLNYMHANENSRSPSLSAFPNIGLVKIEDDGEGE